MERTNKIVINTQNSEIQVLPTEVPAKETSLKVRYNITVEDDNEVVPTTYSTTSLESSHASSKHSKKMSAADSRESFFSSLSLKSSQFKSQAESLIEGLSAMAAAEKLALEGGVDVSNVDYEKFNSMPKRDMKLAEANNSITSSMWRPGYIDEIAVYEYGPFLQKIPDDVVIRPIYAVESKFDCCSCYPQK